MLWVNDSGIARRPIVAIEDHLYHTGEMLDAVATRYAWRLADLTVCVIDRPGPDTYNAVAEWREKYSPAQIVTLADLNPNDLAGFSRGIAALVRPGGIVMQDVQLSTLPFIPADRWWESIYIGATVRGLFADRAPVIRFCSNKRGYDVTFGKELLDAGFDPRDVMDKASMHSIVVPALMTLLEQQFPDTLARRGDTAATHYSVSRNDQATIEQHTDIVLSMSGDKPLLAGRGVSLPVTPKAGGPEAETWLALIVDRIDNGPGIPVVSIGERLAPPHAEKAELTNVAARHIHTLRSRLKDPDSILTTNHCYQLSPALSAGLIQPSHRRGTN